MKTVALVRQAFEMLGVDGEDLVDLKPKMLQKRLTKSGAPVSTQAIL